MDFTTFFSNSRRCLRLARPCGFEVVDCGPSYCESGVSTRGFVTRPHVCLAWRSCVACFSRILHVLRVQAVGKLETATSTILCIICLLKFLSWAFQHRTNPFLLRLREFCQFYIENEVLFMIRVGFFHYLTRVQCEDVRRARLSSLKGL